MHWVITLGLKDLRLRKGVADCGAEEQTAVLLRLENVRKLWSLMSQCVKRPDWCPGPAGPWVPVAEVEVHCCGVLGSSES